MLLPKLDPLLTPTKKPSKATRYKAYSVFRWQ